MSARGTALALSLIAGLSPGWLGAGDIETLQGNAVARSPLPTALRPDRPLLRLAWLDLTETTHGADGVAWAEARELLEEAGFAVTWRRGVEGDESRPGEVRVILVDRLTVDRESRRPVLGATPVGLRQHPFLWIHVRSVRATLGLPLQAPAYTLALRHRRHLGVGLGRVVAHEVVHALAPSFPHGEGLMSETLTFRQLTAAHLSVEPGVALAVAEALPGWPAASESDRTLLAAEGEGEVRDTP